MQPVATFVKVSGPDPRLGKAAGRAFHVCKGGFTALSASGEVFCQSSGASSALLMVCTFSTGIALNEHELIEAIRVITVASIILPYVKQAARSKLSNITQTDLIDCTRYGAQVYIFCFAWTHPFHNYSLCISSAV